MEGEQQPAGSRGVRRGQHRRLQVLSSSQCLPRAPVAGPASSSCSCRLRGDLSRKQEAGKSQPGPQVQLPPPRYVPATGSQGQGAALSPAPLTMGGMAAARCFSCFRSSGFWGEAVALGSPVGVRRLGLGDSSLRGEIEVRPVWDSWLSATGSHRLTVDSPQEGGCPVSMASCLKPWAVGPAREALKGDKCPGSPSLHQVFLLRTGTRKQGGVLLDHAGPSRLRPSQPQARKPGMTRGPSQDQTSPRQPQARKILEEADLDLSHVGPSGTAGKSKPQPD